MKPLLESFRGEGGDAALGRDVSDKLHDIANEWQLRSEIHEARSIRREPRPEIDIAEGVGIQRAHAAFVIVRKKFCFVGGDVNADRAVALAAFAGEAEIERVFDLFAAPSIADDGVAAIGILRHLPEQDERGREWSVLPRAWRANWDTSRRLLRGGICQRQRNEEPHAKDCRDRSGNWKCVLGSQFE